MRLTCQYMSQSEIDLEALFRKPTQWNIKGSFGYFNLNRVFITSSIKEFIATLTAIAPFVGRT